MKNKWLLHQRQPLCGDSEMSAEGVNSYTSQGFLKAKNEVWGFAWAYFVRYTHSPKVFADFNGDPYGSYEVASKKQTLKKRRCCKIATSRPYYYFKYDFVQFLVSGSVCFCSVLIATSPYKIMQLVQLQQNLLRQRRFCRHCLASSTSLCRRFRKR